MKICYPYNEILPKHKAHDVYVFHNTLSLAETELEVHLLCGKGSLPLDSLIKHYGTKPQDKFHTHYLPIIRKNNFLGLTWNRIFFAASQRWIQKNQPEVVIFSVIKQAGYHLKRKIPRVKYVYEVHGLHWYPSLGDAYLSDPKQVKKIHFERSVLKEADLITVTTEMLRNILRAPPYSLTNPIEVVPLSVNTRALPSPEKKPVPQIYYIGQLYQGQGIDLLIDAMKNHTDLSLNIVGGKEDEIQRYKSIAAEKGVLENINFHGFVKPKDLPALAKDADAFVAPFDSSKQMPFVAHTKLLEYASWGRPIIAPDLPCVHEHFPKKLGILPFTVDDVASLSNALEKVKNQSLLAELQSEILSYGDEFSWQNRSKQFRAILQK